MNAALRLLRNVSSNYLRVGVDGVILIVLTPFVVHELGAVLYAVWVIIQTIAYYLGFLDLGIADAQVQRHSVLQARRRTDELGRLHGTVLTFFAAAGVAALVLAIAIVVLPSAELFGFSGAERELYTWVLPVAGLAVLFSFTGSAADGIFEGYERYDWMNAIHIVVAVAEACAIFAALYLGFGIVGLACVKAAAAALEAGAKLWIAYLVFPRHAFPRLGFDRAQWRSIRSFGLWNSLNDVVTEGTAHLDKLLIPILLTSALVTPYSLIVTLAAVIFVVAEPVTETFLPVASRNHGRGDRAAMSVLLTRGSKLVNTATLPATIVILCFGMTILDLWIGAEYTGVAPAVLWFTALSFYFSTYLWTGLSLLMGVGRVRYISLISLVEVAIVLGLIVLLVPWLGLTSLALAGLIGNVMIGMAFFVPAACRVAGLSPGAFLRTTLLRPVLAALPALALGVGLARVVEPQGWLETAACAAATGLTGVVGIFAAAMSPWERARYAATARRVWQLGRIRAGLARSA